jgi:acyl-CoA oxidase
MEEDLAWFMGHNRLSIPRAKQVTPLVNAQCEKLRPFTDDLVEGFGVAWGALKVPILA